MLDMVGRPREFGAGAVVGAAMELFCEKGYEATTTQDLCERTGLGRGSRRRSPGRAR